MLRAALILVVVVASVATTVAKAESQFIDRETEDLEKIAQTVCEIKRGTSVLLSRSQTIADLSEFFSEISIDHKLSSCGLKYAASIDRLAELLTTNNENVCSEGKLEAIEQFHRDYVSLRPKHVENRKSRHLNIPKLVKLFFMSYASKVAQVCAADSLKQMETLKYNSGDEQKDVPEIDSMLGRFGEFFGISELGKGYNEIFLPWLLIDGLPLDKHAKLSAYISTSGDKRLFMKTQNVTQLVNVQAVCQNLMRPIYQRIMMPLIRLADLGYYPASQELAQLLASPSSFRRLYVTTQLCESLLPIQLYEDASLEADQVVLITAVEAANLQPNEALQFSILDGAQVGLTPPENSLSNFEVSLTPTDLHINLIKAHVRARSKSLTRLLKMIARTVSGQLRDKMRRVLFGEKRREPLGAEEVRELAEGDFHELDEVEEEEEDKSGLVRRKRFFRQLDMLLDWLFKLVVFLVLVAVMSVIVVLQFVFLCIPAYIYKLFRYLTGYAIGDVETFFETGINLFASESKQLDLTYRGSRLVKYIGPNKRHPIYVG